MDVILGDIGFTFPLTKDAYAGKDLVVWGNYDAVLAGDTYNGAHSTSSAAQHEQHDAHRTLQTSPAHRAAGWAGCLRGSHLCARPEAAHLAWRDFGLTQPGR